MTKEIFDYSRIPTTEYAYYGFHLKGGRYHIDTKRLKKLKIDYVFPNELFSMPRNTHYFVPKHKNDKDWAINILMGSLNHLEDVWNNEFKTVISKITIPKEVQEQTRLSEIARTSCSDDYDLIEQDAFFAGIYREKDYEEVIKSIHLQYLQKIFVEFFRSLLLTIKDRGYTCDDDFTYKRLCEYVMNRFDVQKRSANPLYTLPHYKWFDVLNKIDNFIKHNTVTAYNALANNAFERNEKLKRFQSSFVYCKHEVKHPYSNGMYAGDWLKIGPDFVDKILTNLKCFSKEFCKLLYQEDAAEASWNSDEALIDLLRSEIIYPTW